VTWGVKYSYQMIPFFDKGVNCSIFFEARR